MLCTILLHVLTLPPHGLLPMDIHVAVPATCHGVTPPTQVTSNGRGIGTRFCLFVFLSAQRVTFPLTEQRNNCMHILQQQTQVRGKRPSTQSSLIGRSWLIFPRCILSLLKAVLALTRGTSSDLIKAPEVGSHPKY